MILEPYFTSDVPDFAAMEAIANAGRYGSIFMKSRCVLMDRDFQPIQLPYPPNKDDPTDASAYITASTLTNNTTRDVHRSCDLQVAEIPGIAFDTLHQRLAVSLQWCDQQFNPKITIPWGVYRFTWPDRDLNDALNTWSIQGDGLTQDIADNDFANTFVTPNLMEVSQVLRGMLLADYLTPSQGGRVYAGGSWPFPNAPALAPSGCENPGPNIPASRLQIPTTSVLLPSTPFKRTQNQLAVMKDIAKTGNIWPLFDDAVGNICSGLIPEYTLTQPPRAWTFRTGQTSTIQPHVIVRLNDPKEMANGVAVVSENNFILSQGGDPIHVDAYNESLASAISTINLKRSIHKTIQDDRIIDLPTALFRAIVELQKRASQDEQVKFTTFPVPLDTHDYIALYVTSPRGVVEISSDAYLFHVVSTTLNIPDRTMEITCERAVGV